MVFHLLNLQIKWQLRLNCSAPWRGDCHHPVSAFLQSHLNETERLHQGHRLGQQSAETGDDCF